MKLTTKEECIEALNHIIYCDRDDKGLSYLSDAYRNDISILSKLIDEHFDNPPLIFIEERKYRNERFKTMSVLWG